MYAYSSLGGFGFGPDPHQSKHIRKNLPELMSSWLRGIHLATGRDSRDQNLHRTLPQLLGDINSRSKLVIAFSYIDLVLWCRTFFLHASDPTLCELNYMILHFRCPKNLRDGHAKTDWRTAFDLYGATTYEFEIMLIYLEALSVIYVIVLCDIIIFRRTINR
jgi:hypothetical protein